MNKNNILVIINTTQFQTSIKLLPASVLAINYLKFILFIIIYHKQKYLYTHIKNKYNTFIQIYTLLIS